MLIIPVGEMNERISLANATAANDGAGGVTTTWTSLSPAEVWAKVEPATAANMERTFAGAVQGVMAYIVTLRNHAAVTLKTRVTWDGRTLLVRGLTRDKKADRLMLACEETV